MSLTLARLHGKEQFNKLICKIEGPMAKIQTKTVAAKKKAPAKPTISAKKPLDKKLVVKKPLNKKPEVKKPASAKTAAKVSIKAPAKKTVAKPLAKAPAKASLKTPVKAAQKVIAKIVTKPAKPVPAAKVANIKAPAVKAVEAKAGKATLATKSATQKGMADKASLPVRSGSMVTVLNTSAASKGGTAAHGPLGTKRVCPHCSTRYYDMNKLPPTCPKCGGKFDPELLLKSRRARAPIIEEEEEVKIVPEDLVDDVPDIDDIPEAETEDADGEEDAVIEDASELGGDADDMEVPLDEDVDDK